MRPLAESSPEWMAASGQPQGQPAPPSKNRRNFVQTTGTTSFICPADPAAAIAAAAAANTAQRRRAAHRRPFSGVPDSEVNELGARGIGEIGLAGFAAAVTAAVHHATGVRVRELPVKIED